MTIQQAVDLGIHELGVAHTHDPEGCARFLLRHILQKSSTQSSVMSLEKLLVSDPNLELSTEDLGLYKNMLLKRRLHEPVWYITNEAHFWKDVFFVDDRVLIPRPETEILVERALGWVRQQIATSKSQLVENRPTGQSRLLSHESRFSVIDVGTGCGAIVISLYKELTGLIPVTMSAIDISPDAIEVAKKNAKRLGASEIKFFVGDALEPFIKKVDLIVGNPPYIPSATIGGLSYDIHHFEPRLAIDGGKDGLDIHRKILKKAKKLIRSDGAILLEIGHDQGSLTRQIAAEYFPKSEIKIIKDYEDCDRILSIKV